jgi:hypothetical protein
VRNALLISGIEKGGRTDRNPCPLIETRSIGLLRQLALQKEQLLRGSFTGSDGVSFGLRQLLLSRLPLRLNFRKLFHDLGKLPLRHFQLTPVNANGNNPNNHQYEINRDLRPLAYTPLGGFFFFTKVMGIAFASYSLLLMLEDWGWRRRVFFGVPSLIVGVLCIGHACHLFGIM